jgi:asparagine N-glycosylation enzyme membrane subunit Stt3
MQPDSTAPDSRSSFLKGPASLAIAVALVILLLLFLPAYRWFFLISVGIGILLAGGIYIWHKWNPITEVQEDENNKRPLGLD